MTDVNRYVGTPYLFGGRTMEGWDCYGLVIHYFREELGLTVPDWAADDESLRAVVKILTEKVREELEGGLGVEVELGDRQDNDVVTVEKNSLQSHIGVLINGGVLHCQRPGGTVFEPWHRFVSNHANNSVRVWRWQR